jgi:hypothetical protein
LTLEVFFFSFTALLHPTDKRLDFVRSQSVTPMAIIKIRMKTYLVCYKGTVLRADSRGVRFFVKPDLPFFFSL